MAVLGSSLKVRGVSVLCFVDYCTFEANLVHNNNHLGISRQKEQKPPALKGSQEK